MTHYLADPSLGLSGQARAVLAMLSATECHGVSSYDDERRDYDVEINTFAWYNGRERGVCLEVRAFLTDQKALLITFGEHRNSDSIFVDSWEVHHRFLNPPTVSDFPDEAYEARTFVPYGDLAGAVKVIRAKIADYMAERAKDAKDALAITIAATPARVLPELGEDAEAPLSEVVGRIPRRRQPRRLGA